MRHSLVQCAVSICFHVWYIISHIWLLLFSKEVNYITVTLRVAILDSNKRGFLTQTIDGHLYLPSFLVIAGSKSLWVNKFEACSWITKILLKILLKLVSSYYKFLITATRQCKTINSFLTSYHCIVYEEDYNFI